MSIERIKRIVNNAKEKENSIRAQYKLGSYEYQNKEIHEAILELNENIKTLDDKILHLNSKFEDWKQYVTELRDQM